jgi:hypothetical protein
MAASPPTTWACSWWPISHGPAAVHGAAVSGHLPLPAARCTRRFPAAWAAPRPRCWPSTPRSHRSISSAGRSHPHRRNRWHGPVDLLAVGGYALTAVPILVLAALTFRGGSARRPLRYGQRNSGWRAGLTFQQRQGLRLLRGHGSSRQGDGEDGVPKLRLPMRAAPLSYLRIPVSATQRPPARRLGQERVRRPAAPRSSGQREAGPAHDAQPVAAASATGS